MKKVVIIALLISFSLYLSAKTITDMAGRKVTVPNDISKIVPHDAKTSILLFSVAADKMLAKAMIPGSKRYQLIDAAYNQLPEVDIKNIEELMAVKPQLIIAASYLAKVNTDKFEKLQKRSKIPVVIVDLSLDKLDETYLFLGDLLNAKEACTLRANYIKEVYKKTNDFLNNEDVKTPSVYYTIGGSGLMTDPSGSKHTEVIDFMKLNNVAKVPIPTGGHAKVNMEQVFIWNPELIFCAGFKGDKNAYKSITTDDKWKNIEAVKNKQVYKVPSRPFGWFDHPPTVNRIAGIIWLGQLFYGQSVAETKSQITEFYKLFYAYNLSDSEYSSLFE